MTAADELREEVRRYYADAARAMLSGAGGCGCSCCGDDCAPTSFGCGNPVDVADLHEGESVLDLGSGGGADAVLAAKRVGPRGVVYGLDMTDEMLELAQRTAAAAGAANVHLLKGVVERIPLPSGSVDVVVSNCVLNLSTDKSAALREIARVLKPGGRVGISDIVAEDRLSPEERATRGSYAGCIAGALSRAEYAEGLEEAGLVDVSVRFTHEVADGMHAAIVRARNP
ncbi:MAG TPA: methyltransferase domain-containing protein [Gaiellaceae bacterium]|nr:methyltransferase domain-containing protein [Gaiellaceae bacterium]